MQTGTIDLELPQAVVKQEEKPQMPAVVNESVAMMSMIERVAINPDVNIDKLERLMAMHEKLKAQQALEAYAQAMRLVQAEIPAIVKDRTNTHTNTMYATLEAISDGITPVFTKHGFSISYDTFEAKDPNSLGVTCEVMHSGGHAKSYRMEVPLDNAGTGGKTNKTGIQARGSSFTYAKRYLLVGIFNVNLGGKSEDNDGNNESTRFVTPAQAKMIRKELDQCTDAVKARFAELRGMPETVPADCFNIVIGGLRKSRGIGVHE